MRVREFVALLTEKVYGVLCQGTKPISRQDVTQFVREFYALGKGQTRRVSPADRLRERYERDVKTHGIPVGTFLERVLWSRDRLVSQDGGHWRDEPQLSPKQLRHYNQLLRSRTDPVDQELSRINESRSFGIVRLCSPPAAGPVSGRGRARVSSGVHVEDRVLGLASWDHQPWAAPVGGPQ